MGIKVIQNFGPSKLFKIFGIVEHDGGALCIFRERTMGKNTFECFFVDDDDIMNDARYFLEYIYEVKHKENKMFWWRDSWALSELLE